MGVGVDGFWAKRKQKSDHSENIKKLGKEIYVLEQKYIDLEARHKGYKEYNPLYPVASLVGGILG